jgi:cation transport ATPase
MLTTSQRQSSRAWLARHVAAMLLAVTVCGLATGGVLRLSGAIGAADAAWLAVGACGAAYALWAMADSLRRRRVGVDVIALLALGGAIAVGELLAAAVISVMLASGRALEGWAAGRPAVTCGACWSVRRGRCGAIAAARWRRYRSSWSCLATCCW